MTDTNTTRTQSIRLLVLAVGALLIGKAFQLQVLDREFHAKAKYAALDERDIYPSRGLITDRQGHILVYNSPVYDLMLTYHQLDEQMDTAYFCELLNITREDFEANTTKDWRSGRYSKSVPYVFLSRISPHVLAVFQEHLHEFPGFFIQVRNVRSYPHQHAAHLLGYIREVDENEVNDSLQDYDLGDYIGGSGLEQTYESLLRGQKGHRLLLKDNLGRIVDANTNQESPAVSGDNLITTIDLDLQAYAEKLLVNKIGSIVAIEPATGEVLIMASSPNYDPNLMTLGKGRGQNYARLQSDSLQPLYNRSVLAKYPPGSLFKPLVALVGLQLGTLRPYQTVACPGGYMHNGQLLMGCHAHPTCTNVAQAIQHSCNAYFATAFRSIVDQNGFYNPQSGLDTFNYFLDHFGLGHKLGLDFPIESAGNYPTSAYFDKVYKKERNWNSIWIRSLGIGQGELEMTTLQMANLAAIIGNRGYYVQPHLIRGTAEVIDTSRMLMTQQMDWPVHHIPVDSEHYGLVVDGMNKVVTSGTARSAFVEGLDICGKTGTAENNQRTGKDHSIFFAFAPKDNPTIAIAVYVENGGFGGTYAAPMASLLIEQSINDSIGHNRQWLEQRILDANLLPDHP